MKKKQTNTPELRAAIARSGFSQKELAHHLGITPTSLYQKIYNIREFKASEIATLSKILNAENWQDIFFDGMAN